MWYTIGVYYGNTKGVYYVVNYRGLLCGTL